MRSQAAIVCTCLVRSTQQETSFSFRYPSPPETKLSGLRCSRPKIKSLRDRLQHCARGDGGGWGESEVKYSVLWIAFDRSCRFHWAGIARSSPKVLCWQVLVCKVSSKRQGQNSKVPSVLEAYRALRQRRGPEAASGHGRAWRAGASEGPLLAGLGVQGLLEAPRSEPESSERSGSAPRVESAEGAGGCNTLSAIAHVQTNQQNTGSRLEAALSSEKSLEATNS